MNTLNKLVYHEPDLKSKICSEYFELKYNDNDLLNIGMKVYLPLRIFKLRPGKVCGHFYLKFEPIAQMFRPDNTYWIQGYQTEF